MNKKSRFYDFAALATFMFCWTWTSQLFSGIFPPSFSPLFPYSLRQKFANMYVKLYNWCSNAWSLMRLSGKGLCDITKYILQLSSLYLTILHTPGINLIQPDSTLVYFSLLYSSLCNNMNMKIPDIKNKFLKPGRQKIVPTKFLQTSEKGKVGQN